MVRQARKTEGTSQMERFNIEHRNNGRKCRSHIEADEITVAIKVAVMDCRRIAGGGSWMVESLKGDRWATGNADGVVAGCY
jgi:hypothetical protein